MSSKVVGVGVLCLCVLTGCYEFHLRDGARGDRDSAGGGVLVRDRSPVPPALVLVNVTLSGNLAHARSQSRRSRAGGGGLAIDVTSMQPMSVRLSNVTIAANDAHADMALGGGLSSIQATHRASIELNDCIIWNNTRSGGAVADDCDTAGMRGVHNFVSDLACLSGADSTNRRVDPQLGALATPTGQCAVHPIHVASPAHNGGSPGGCLASNPVGTAETTVYQCGRVRTGACDVGAAEATP